MNTATATAVQYARSGWHVFPISPGQKTPPPGLLWRNESTDSIDKITAWAEQYPDCNWAVDCGKSNIFVVDIDNKPEPEKNGFVTMQAQGLDFPSGFVIETPTGGQHIYFTGTGPNTAGKIGPGIDTRGAGGYVLIPGSINGNGTPYKFMKTGSIKPMTDFLIDKLRQQTEKRQDRNDAVVELDQAHNVETAIDYLLNHAPTAIEGQHGDLTTYQVACAVRDFGISQALAFDLMLLHYNDQCEPPWRVEELQQKVRNAYTYSKDRAGNRSAEAKFGVQDLNQLTDPFANYQFGSAAAPVQAQDEIMFTRASSYNPEDIPPRQWILGYRYLRNYVTLTVAPGGVGKSLLTILEALSIASGIDLTHDGLKLGRPGKVWIYNTEDPLDEMKRRVSAAAIQHGVPVEYLDNIIMTSGYDRFVRIAGPDQNGNIIQNIPEINRIVATIKKENIDLFVLDPLIESHSVPENDNNGMAIVIDAFRRVAKEGDCAVSLVHHTSKGKAEHGNMDKVRGASSIVSMARVSHTFYNMTREEAELKGIPPDERTWYARLTNAKQNLGPPSAAEDWYHKLSVQVSTKHQDTTGALEKIHLDNVEQEGPIGRIMNAIPFAVPPGEYVSLNELAARLNGGRIRDLGETTIRNALKDIFAVEHVIEGDIYRPGEVRARNGHTVAGVYRLSIEDLL